MTRPVNAAATTDHAARVPVLDGGGSISWEEHCEAFRSPNIREVTRTITGSPDPEGPVFGLDFPHSPETVAQAGGFGYAELVRLLGHEPRTFERDS